MTPLEPRPPGPAPTLTVDTATGDSVPASGTGARPAIDEAPPPGSTADRAAGAGTGGPAWRRRLLSYAGLYLLLLALCAPMVGLYVQRHGPLSTIDEFAYSDYLYKVHQGQPFVRRNEKHGQETLRLLACRGYHPDIWPASERPPCDAPSYIPEYFPNSGINSGDIHPPTYFVVTDLGARVIMGLGVTGDLITAGRFFGAAWLAAGLLALWCLLRALGANRWAAALGLGLVTANPVLREQWYYITPDAPNLLVGSLVALAALRWERRGRGLLLLAGAGALAMGIKAPNLMVVGAVAAYFLVRAWLARRPPPGDKDENEAEIEDGVGFRTPRQYLTAAASLLAGGGVTALVWVVVRSALALPGEPAPIVAAFVVDQLRFGYFAENLARFITVWDHGTKAQPLAVITSYVLIGSLLAALVALSPRQRRHSLALVTGAVVVVGPLILVLISYVTTGTYFLVQGRYGSSLIPLQAAIAASFWRTRAALVVVGGLVVAYHGAVLVVMLRQ